MSKSDLEVRILLLSTLELRYLLTYNVDTKYMYKDVASCVIQV